MMHASMNLIVFSCFMMMFLSMVSRQQRLLSMLLCMEGLMLYMVCLLLLVGNSMLMVVSPLVVFVLSVSVSSASIGLSLLVITSRSKGNDSMLGCLYHL